MTDKISLDEWYRRALFDISSSNYPSNKYWLQRYVEDVKCYREELEVKDKALELANYEAHKQGCGMEKCVCHSEEYWIEEARKALQKDLLPDIILLESDSELLNGLIELFQFGAVMQMHTEELPDALNNYYFAMFGDIWVGQTPREAIEAAVRKWKEGK